MINCDTCFKPLHRSPSRVKKHNFCCLEHYHHWLKKNISPQFKNYNKNRIYTNEDRERLAGYRKGRKHSEEHKEYLKRINKAHPEWKTGFKNVDLSKRRGCALKACENEVFGRLDLCRKHFKKTIQYKLENRARINLYSMGFTMKQIPKEIFLAMVELEKAKENIWIFKK